MLYATGCDVLQGDDASLQQAVETAAQTEVVVLALGGSPSRFSGAQFDTNGAAVVSEALQMDCGEGVDVSDLRLPACQRKLANRIFSLGKPVVTVVVAGRPYALAEIAQQTQALVRAFYPGPWGGQALAELLLGHLAPSGRLPASLPHTAGQIPCYHNPIAGYAPLAYSDAAAAPLYSFGSGLSYTSFSFEQVALCESDTNGVCVQFTVANTGETSGWAVPMLYVRLKTVGQMPRSRILCGFQRVFLAAGEQKRLAITAIQATHLGAKALHKQDLAALWLEENAVAVWQNS